MGWSCEWEAGRVMDRIQKLHGKDALIQHDGDEYFVDFTNREYKDGRIYAEVYRVISKTASKLRCVREGSFYILPGGKISKRAIEKFPFLKEVVR